jgi:hypothetical protein
MTGLLLLTLIGNTNAQQCDDLKNDMKALEIYLKDQEDYEKYCPKLKWEQPDISVYKEKLKSQLPSECKN